MVDFPINSNVFKIGDQITVPISKLSGVKWFDEDITIQTSNNNRGTTIVVDFSYTTTTVIEYTLDGTNFIKFNNGVSITGGQSRYIRVTNGNTVNFKANSAGTLNRCIVGEV